MNTDSVAARPEGSNPRTHWRNADAVLKQTAQALAGLYGASLGVFTLDCGGESLRVASQDGNPGDTIPDFPYSYALPIIGRDGGKIGLFTCYSNRPLRPREQDCPQVNQLLATAVLADENVRLNTESRELTAQIENAKQLHLGFIRSVVHDLRSPFVAVSNMAQLLRIRCGETLDDQTNELISLTTGAVDRGLALLSSLSAYSLIGTTAVEPCPIQLTEAVGVALFHLDKAVRQCGAVITTDELPVIIGRRDDIEQVLIHIIQNALTFRGTNSPRVHISAIMSGEQWVVSVSDNGAGFDNRYASQIFEPFKRLGGNRFPGSGLGLAICKKIVELHQGSIWAESEPGKGSVFRFTLPAASQSGAAATHGALC